MRSSRLTAAGICALLLAVFGIATAGSTASAYTTMKTVAAKHSTPHWSAVPSVNAPPIYQSNAVSCPTASFCMAVGAAEGSPGAEDVYQGLAEVWNGHRWSVVTPPAGLGGNLELTGVSCVSASFCAAVGDYENETANTDTAVFDMWDGHSWSSKPSTAFPGDLTISGVSCTSPTFCMVVGDNNDNAQCLDGGSADRGQDALAEKWDGQAWLVVDAPEFGQCGTSGHGQNSYLDTLTAVSCTSSTACVSVGTFNNALGVTPAGQQTAGATWNGTAWTAHDALDPNESDTLDGVSCTAVTACLAVGSTTISGTQSQELAQEWNGTAWTLVPAPAVTNRGAFDGVSCTGPTTCVAVGTDGSTSDPTLIEQWTGGTTWARHAAPAVYQADGVSCLGPTQCTVSGYAVTAFSGSAFTDEALVLTSKGSSYQRTVLPNPNIAPSRLLSTSCVAKTCFGVGDFTQFGVRTWPLIERSHGSTWVNSVAPGEADVDTVAALSGISCVSVHFCMTVGRQTGLDEPPTISLEWNGESWSNLTTASSPSSSVLSAVSCVTARFCMAVGQQPAAAAGTTLGLTEVWNGSTWAATKASSPGKQANALSAVSCATPTDCVAVGQQSATSGPSRVLTERWNGHRWTVIKGHNPGSNANDLTGISCPSRHGCVAVGYDASSARRHTLIETLLDGRWSVSKSKNVTGASNALNSVSCLSLTRCDAVGAAEKRTLAETLAGTKWAITKSANRGTETNTLLGVSCDASVCSAVGSHDASAPQTLVERLIN